MSDEKPVEVKPSLVRKLAEVMAEVHRIPKRGRNEFHRYDYVTEADIVEGVRNELAKRHLMILPRVSSQEVREVIRKTKDGEKSALVTFANMTFAIVDGDSGEALEFPWIGSGEDSGDKGLYKAITGATKYFLLKLFLIPTGDDPETDKRKPKDQRTHADARRREPQPEPSAVPAYVAITPEQAQKVREVIARSGVSKADAGAEVQRVCGPSVHSVAEIPADKYEAVMASLSKAVPA